MSKEVSPTAAPKFCPYLPPVMVQDPTSLNPNAAPQPSLIPCQGEQCAVYSTCQGENSPAALRKLLEDFGREHGESLRKAGEIFSKLQNSPLLGRFFPG